VNSKNTKDPAQYGNYDPAPYLDATSRAAQIMFGSDASTTSGGLPADRQGSFDDRFEKWGSSPARVAPLTPPDGPESFGNRFGNWGFVPASASRDSRSPVLRALERYRRSAAPDGRRSVHWN
jgi:hypothetical protein